MRWRAIGYGLLGLSATIDAYIAYMTDFEYKKEVMGILVISGMLGKFITDCVPPEKK